MQLYKDTRKLLSEFETRFHSNQCNQTLVCVVLSLYSCTFAYSMLCMCVYVCVPVLSFVADSSIAAAGNGLSANWEGNGHIEVAQPFQGKAYRHNF